MPTKSKPATFTVTGPAQFVTDVLASLGSRNAAAGDGAAGGEDIGDAFLAKLLEDLGRDRGQPRGPRGVRRAFSGSFKAVPLTEGALHYEARVDVVATAPDGTPLPWEPLFELSCSGLILEPRPDEDAAGAPNGGTEGAGSAEGGAGPERGPVPLGPEHGF